MDGGPEPVTEEDVLAAHRRQAVKVFVRGSAIAVAVTATGMLLN